MGASRVHVSLSQSTPNGPVVASSIALVHSPGKTQGCLRLFILDESQLTDANLGALLTLIPRVMCSDLTPQQRGPPFQGFPSCLPHGRSFDFQKVGCKSQDSLSSCKIVFDFQAFPTGNSLCAQAGVQAYPPKHLRPRGRVAGVGCA